MKMMKMKINYLKEDIIDNLNINKLNIIRYILKILKIINNILKQKNHFFHHFKIRNKVEEDREINFYIHLCQSNNCINRRIKNKTDK